MKHLTILFIIIFLACESPFSTEPTDGDIFSATHNYDGEKIYIPTPITVEWSKITIKNFKEFLVERSADYGDSIAWEERAHILDSLQVSYIDIIDDDITFQYRIRIVDQDDQFIHALSSPLVIPKVSSLKVPDQYDSLQVAFDSHFIDDGDTINVFPGLYQDHFEFLDKNAIIRAVMIPEITILAAAPDTGSVVTINKGELNGFTVTGGKSLAGGGVHASGTAIIRNCLIRNNFAINNDTKTQIYPYGMGGGVFLQNEAKLIKCRVASNRSDRVGGGILTDGNNSIINCTIDNNASSLFYGGGGLFQYEGGQLLIRNTNFIRNYTNMMGGAMIIIGNAEIYNCLFEKNRNRNGGGILIEGPGAANIVNCFFYNNMSSSRNYSGAVVSRGEVSIMNTIIWMNSGYKDFKLFSKHSNYTISDEFKTESGVGNLISNPSFINIEGRNYRLSEGSPGVNAGHPSETYNDADGTRNNIGIYGGPFGDDW